MDNQTKKKPAPTAILSSSKDLPLLMFLWRWKVSTTAVLSHKFYPERTPAKAYEKLRKLERAGFIQARCNHTADHFIWMLDKRGFSVLRFHLLDMKEEGYLSENMFHDLLVAAVHLGDSLFKEINTIEFFTEQELRRLDPVTFPEWVPHCSRRPDGYWAVRQNSGYKVVALEVELSIKADAEYESIARFYEEREGVHQILWVVKRASIAKKIHALMERVTRRAFKHSFLILDPFYSLGWQAPIHCGLDAGKSINQVLGNTCGTAGLPVPQQFHLDTRKSPHRSSNYRFSQPQSFFY